jgi:putative membrane-bound dehydrogenase-like protein
MKTPSKIKFILLLVPFSLAGGYSLAQRYPGPLSPEESLKKLHVAPGFTAQIYAAEPFVMDPVALEFDEQGNAFVVEMPDYPYEVEPGKGHGRIKMLSDTNGDGRIDKASIFSENVTEATSILPWKGGLIVTAAPHILYLKDTDGDGKSDTTEVLFSGFFQNNSEAQVTSLRFGIDNWIYANNRGQSGKVSFSRTPGEAPMEVRGADFRFRLDRNLFELETGPGQFGQTINDWGHRFFTENSIHLQQAVIPWRYTHRHPFLPTSKFNVTLSDHEEIMFQETAPPYWRAERSSRRNKMYQENNMNRTEYAEDRFTGASGGTVYNGDALPKEFYGNIFTADVAGNLVHRDILSADPNSPVYIARRAASEKEREFIYSTDPWFRPVVSSVGPDGYLYVLDYYRQHIETPVSIPDDLKADMDFMAGSDRGRIYRIMPEGSGYKGTTVGLKNMTTTRLVEELARSNGWWRTQAQRLLLERQDKSVLPLLRSYVNKHKDPRTRLHALYVLEGLNSLDAEIIKKALNDSAPAVREHALILAEGFPETLALIMQKTNDADRRVALQAVLSAGNFDSPEVTAALANAAEKYGEDIWFRNAVLSSNVGSSTELLKALSQRNSFMQSDASWKGSFLQDLSVIIGARNNREQVRTYLDLISQPGWEKSQSILIKGLKTGLSKNESANAQLKAALDKITPDTQENTKAGIAILKGIY